MTDELRIDLLAIVLEEAFGMQESYARKLLDRYNYGEPRFRQADSEALDVANHLVQRIEARCSRIEG